MVTFLPPLESKHINHLDEFRLVNDNSQRIKGAFRVMVQDFADNQKQSDKTFENQER